MNESQMVVNKAKGTSKIWLVPIIAALLGMFMVIQDYLSKGPEISLRFETANGLEAGKTKVKFRSVDIGTVTLLNLADDNENVQLSIQLEPSAKNLLREDTQFWVVRPRIGAAGISGLSTIFSGAYIKLVPGEGANTKKRSFIGLEEVPTTPIGTPGIRLSLSSNSSKSLDIGDGVLYRGFTVGQVESSKVDIDTRKILYEIFIKSPYDKFVTSKTRFWNAGGIGVDISTEGVDVRMESLMTLVSGGVSFDLPENALPGDAASDGDNFSLYPDEESINKNPHREHKNYVISFNQSLRGLNPGAAVEYRGIRIGQVRRIMFDEMVEKKTLDKPRGIPVEIYLTPALFKLNDNAAGLERMEQAIKHAIEKNHLRATLTTSSILTGQLYVELDYRPDSEPQQLTTLMGLPAIPSVEGGLDNITEQVNKFLKKINALPLNSLVDSADESLQQLEKTLASADQAMANANKILGSEKLQQLPQTLDTTIQSYSANSKLHERLHRTTQELNNTLKSVQKLTETLNKQPNSLIFSKKINPDLTPNSAPGGE